MLSIVENPKTSEFYPTPKELAGRMLSGVELDLIETVLEPQAGKGDLLIPLAEKEGAQYRAKQFDVDCIEIDTHLRQILKHRFSEDFKKEIRQKINSLEAKHGELTQKEQELLQKLNAETGTFFKKGIHIVHDDFLTYEPHKQYDLILMNPPFSNGDKHLLKALRIQRNGGSIICLLNAETIRNPYTHSRRTLVDLLTQYSAKIEYVSNAFADAQRKADVEIAVIKVNIKSVLEESTIYSGMAEAENCKDIPENVTDLEVTDYIKMIISKFSVEVKSGICLIRQYRALVPYMLQTIGKSSPHNSSILRLTDGNDRSYSDVKINDYVKKTRLKYWKALLANPKFTGKLTSSLQEKYRTQVDELSDYDFTEFNINTLSAELSLQIKSGIENEIITMFDKLTYESSWYPECAKNRHYYDGWKTNKAHKIDKKVILSCYGVFDSWSGNPKQHEAKGVLEDIEKILNYLDGGMTTEVSLGDVIARTFHGGSTKNIPCKYFNATFYKKGTVHLAFTNPRLIERFNIYAAQRKAWLPPSYGKQPYSNMPAEEQTIVDSFQGENAYAEIMAQANYYLAPVHQQNVMLLR